MWPFVFGYEHEPIENVCNVSEVTAAHVHEASLINGFPEDKQLTSPHVFWWKVRVDDLTNSTQTSAKPGKALWLYGSCRML